MRKAIYKIENIVNHKIYIGQTINPKKRWKEHRTNAKLNHDNYPIHQAIKKYGEENFSFSIIEWTENFNEREIELIKKYNSKIPHGYNISNGGENYIMYGENNPKNTIKQNIVNEIIKELKNNNLSDREIAKKYNTTDKIVSDINHGITHYQKEISYPIRIKKGLQKIKQEELNTIKYLLKNTNKSYQEIADIFNLSKGTIYHINKGLTFHNINEKYPIRDVH